MNLGVAALFLAVGASIWLLWRLGKGEAVGGAKGGAGADKRTITLLKAVAFLVVATALFAAKLWPLAFMTIVAAAAVAGIETWRERAIREAEKSTDAALAPSPAMDRSEARSVLGVEEDASAEEIRAAHRKLIAQLHPDKGGTDYLAAKINDARDLLIGGSEKSGDS
jgi:hypothetical protein